MDKIEKIKSDFTKLQSFGSQGLLDERLLTVNAFLFERTNLSSINELRKQNLSAQKNLGRQCQIGTSPLCQRYATSVQYCCAWIHYFWFNWTSLNAARDRYPCSLAPLYVITMETAIRPFMQNSSSKQKFNLNATVPFTWMPVLGRPPCKGIFVRSE